MFDAMTASVHEGAGHGPAHRGAPIHHRRRHPPALPRPGGGDHHPGDRPGRRASPRARSSGSSPTRPPCSTRSSRPRSTPPPPTPRSRRIDPSLPLEARLVAVGRDPPQARALPVPRVQRRLGHHTRRAARSAATTSPRSPRSSKPRPTHLSRPPADAARVLRGLTFACVHPSFGTDEPLTSEEIVAVLLDGIRRRQPGRSRRADQAHPRLPVQVPQVADPRPRLPDDPVASRR